MFEDSLGLRADVQKSRIFLAGVRGSLRDDILRIIVFLRKFSVEW